MSVTIQERISEQIEQLMEIDSLEEVENLLPEISIEHNIVYEELTFASITISAMAYTS